MNSQQKLQRQQLKILENVMKPHHQQFILSRLNQLLPNQFNRNKLENLFSRIGEIEKKGTINFMNVIQFVYNEQSEPLYRISTETIRISQKPIPINLLNMDYLIHNPRNTYIANKTQMCITNIHQSKVTPSKMVSFNCKGKIKNISICDNLLGLITFQNQLYARSLIDFNEKYQLQIQSIKLSQNIDPIVLLFEGNKLSNGWMIITSNFILLYKFLSPSPPILQLPLKKQAIKVCKINDERLAIMYDEPCIDLYQTKYFTITFKIFNYVRYSSMCYCQRFNCLVLYDFSGCMFKYTINMNYGYIHDAILNQQEYYGLKFTNKATSSAYHLNSAYKNQRYSRVNIKSNRQFKSPNIPDRFIRNQHTIIMQYPKSSGPKPIITIMTTASTTLLTYQEKQNLITFFDILTLIICQKIKLEINVIELLFEDYGLFLISDKKMVYYCSTNRQNHQEQLKTINKSKTLHNLHNQIHNPISISFNNQHMKNIITNLTNKSNQCKINTQTNQLITTKAKLVTQITQSQFYNKIWPKTQRNKTLKKHQVSMIQNLSTNKKQSKQKYYKSVHSCEDKFQTLKKLNIQLKQYKKLTQKKKLDNNTKKLVDSTQYEKLLQILVDKKKKQSKFKVTNQLSIHQRLIIQLHQGLENLKKQYLKKGLKYKRQIKQKISTFSKKIKQSHLIFNNKIQNVQSNSKILQFLEIEFQNFKRKYNEQDRNTIEQYHKLVTKDELSEQIRSNNLKQSKKKYYIKNVRQNKSTFQKSRQYYSNLHHKQLDISDKQKTEKFFRLKKIKQTLFKAQQQASKEKKIRLLKKSLQQFQQHVNLSEDAIKYLKDQIQSGTKIINSIIQEEQVAENVDNLINQFRQCKLKQQHQIQQIIKHGQYEKNLNDKLLQYIAKNQNDKKLLPVIVFDIRNMNRKQRSDMISIFLKQCQKHNTQLNLHKSQFQEKRMKLQYYKANIKKIQLNEYDNIISQINSQLSLFTTKLNLINIKQYNQRIQGFLLSFIEEAQDMQKYPISKNILQMSSNVNQRINIIKQIRYINQKIIKSNNQEQQIYQSLLEKDIKSIEQLLDKRIQIISNIKIINMEKQNKLDTLATQIRQNDIIKKRIKYEEIKYDIKLKKQKLRTLRYIKMTAEQVSSTNIHLVSHQKNAREAHILKKIQQTQKQLQKLMIIEQEHLNSLNYVIAKYQSRKLHNIQVQKLVAKMKIQQTAQKELKEAQTAKMNIIYTIKKIKQIKEQFQTATKKQKQIDRYDHIMMTTAETQSALNDAYKQLYEIEKYQKQAKQLLHHIKNTRLLFFPNEVEQSDSIKGQQDKQDNARFKTLPLQQIANSKGYITTIFFKKLKGYQSLNQCTQTQKKIIKNHLK